jgi:hypothetical protein
VTLSVVRAAALAVVALVCWLSRTPQPPQPAGLPSGSDLLVHLLMHATVAALVATGWRGRPWVAPALAALAVGLEAGQLAAPGRSFAFADLAMNLGGAALGWIAATRLQPIRVAASRSSSSVTPKPGASDRTSQPSRGASGSDSM